MKTMKMPRLSTGSVHLWNDKMSRSVARSLAFRLHRLLPVIAARVTWTHLWSSRMMKKSMQTLCCWPLRPKLGMKNQTTKKLRKDTIRLIMIKPKLESLRSKNRSLCLFLFLCNWISSTWMQTPAWLAQWQSSMFFESVLIQNFQLKFSVHPNNCGILNYLITNWNF